MRKLSLSGRRRYVVVAALGLTVLLAGCRAQATPPMAARSPVPVGRATASETVQAGASPPGAGTLPSIAQPATAAVLPTSLPLPPATPTSTATAPPTGTASPTTAPSPAATATVVPKARQLTTGGCCWDPFFLDGQVAFIDRPSQDAQAGFYAVPLSGGQERLVEPQLGFLLDDGKYLSYQQGAATVVQRRSDGKRWQLNTAGQPVSLSPDESSVAWSVRDWAGAYDRRVSRLWRAPLEGGQPVQVTTLYGGGLVAWLSGDRWLLSGRRALNEPDRALFLYDLKTGESRDLLKAQGFRSVSVSPDGTYALVVIALDPQHDRNGTWLVPLGGGDPRKLDWFGAFAWRDARHILYIPYKTEAASDELWVYDLADGASRRLIDPSLTPFKIAQGDWVLSPDGRTLVFVSAADQNLWALDLAP